MAKLLDQASAGLSSSAAISSGYTILQRPSPSRVLMVSSSRAASTSPSDLSWEKKKQSKRRKNADLLVPASLLTEDRGAGKEIGAALTIVREDRWINSFDQIGLCRRGEFDRSRGTAEYTAVVEGPKPKSPPLVDDKDSIWLQMRREARVDSEEEPALASYLYSTILAHRSLERALAFHLGNKLSCATFLSTQLNAVLIDTIMEDDTIRDCIRADIVAVKDRDPACVSYAHCLLNFKGYLALQSHRVAHRLWKQGRQALAFAMQSRVSEVFGVDIHPGAQVGKGILLDHATGVVVGETAVIGNNVSILHHVTLGGTGAKGGDRHPKIGDGVLIGAAATILGNVRVGEGAKIGAGSVVLTDIPAHTTAVGNPARLVGGKRNPKEMTEVPGKTMDHTSFLSDWSDYVI